jgi:uncharacterized protein (UPF0548 family)
VSRLLLDTHALLWFVANDSAQSGTARTLIEAADDVVWLPIPSWQRSVRSARRTGEPLVAGVARRAMMKLPNTLRPCSMEQY